MRHLPAGHSYNPLCKGKSVVFPYFGKKRVITFSEETGRHARRCGVIGELLTLVLSEKYRGAQCYEPKNPLKREFAGIFFRRKVKNQKAQTWFHPPPGSLGYNILETRCHLIIAF